MHLLEVESGFDMCWYPITLKASHTSDGEYLPVRNVPCGKCIACLQKKRADWSFRIRSELKEAKNATFLTLTLNDENLQKKEGIPTLQKKQLQDYFKRVRHEAKELKYYAVGEYGTKTFRPHYHAIVFNCTKHILRSKWSTGGSSMGIVTTDSVTPASIHYVTGYILKKYGTMDKKTGVSVSSYPSEIQKPFAIMSKGIGKNYAVQNKNFHISGKTFQTTAFNQKGTLSRYLKMKIFENDELLRLNITEQESQKIKNELREKNPKKQFTARQYYKTLINYANQKAKL